MVFYLESFILNGLFELSYSKQVWSSGTMLVFTHETRVQYQKVARFTLGIKNFSPPTPVYPMIGHCGPREP